MLVPLLGVGLTTLGQRRWLRLGQLGVSALVAIAVMLPWLSVNWVFQFSIVENTNVRSAQAEGDPMLQTLAAWTYYWQDLPAAVSWILLLVPLGGLVFWAVGRLSGRRSPRDSDGTPRGRLWLGLFVLGAYLLWSVILNKDPRYIAPYLPALAVFLGWGLVCWGRLWRWLPGLTLGLSGLVTLLTLFPPGGVATTLATWLAPQGPYPPAPEAYPHPAVIAAVAQAQPYQIATLGGLQSTPVVNQHNISYYGKLQDYQVYGRQVGDRPSLLEQDRRSLSWFYAQGPLEAPWPPAGDDTNAVMVRQLEADPAFVRDRSWDLPNQSRLYLYRRQPLPVTVTPLPAAACAGRDRPRLTRVDVPERVPPGQPVPVTYEWTGTWQALRFGTVLLTWEPLAAGARTSAPAWIHDHGIGLGSLRPQPIQANQTTLGPAAIPADACFRVTERTATLPPAAAAPGSYRLVGDYIATGPDAATSAPQPLDLPVFTLTLDPQAAAPAAPELDWVTQLRQVSQFLPQGPDYLDEVFDPLGRLNLYDPVQAYTVQAEQTLRWRWQAQPQVLAYGYGLVLAQVLQLKVEAAIASLEQLVQRDADNPYAHAYLGFVNLYAFRPGAAQAALQPALALAPDSPEIRALSALASLFRGNLWGAWQQGRAAIARL